MIGVEFLCADGSLICTDGVFLAIGTTLLSLITDRTQADVDRVRQLAQKVFGNMAAGEKTKWLNGLEGAYNASDLNRVGASVAGRLSQEEFDQLVDVEK